MLFLNLGVHQKTEHLNTFLCMRNSRFIVSPSADSTGTHSLYTTYKDYEIMFHVSTMLPYTPNNKQQVCYVFMLQTSCKYLFMKKMVI